MLDIQVAQLLLLPRSLRAHGRFFLLIFFFSSLAFAFLSACRLRWLLILLIFGSIYNRESIIATTHDNGFLPVSLLALCTFLLRIPRVSLL